MNAASRGPKNIPFLIFKFPNASARTPPKIKFLKHRQRLNFLFIGPRLTAFIEIQSRNLVFFLVFPRKSGIFSGISLENSLAKYGIFSGISLAILVPTQMS